MADDFNPTQDVRQVSFWKDNAARADLYPAVGSKVAIVYIEADPADAAAVNTKLNEIQALATSFVKKVWTPTAEVGKRPSIKVRVSVSTTEEIPIP